MLISTTVILVVLIIVGATVNRKKAGGVSNVMGTVLSPAQGLLAGAGNSVSGFFEYLTNMNRYEKENKALRERIATLEDELRKTDELKAENERLRKMLELNESEKEYETVAADVIAYEMDNLSKTYTINKGIKDGITQNCAVITPYGLVGYISEVGRNWAKISPIVDSRVSVSASVQRVSKTAIVQGDMTLMENGLCKMTYVTKESGIEIGDHVETSGAGGLIPAGIYIGKVSEIKDDVTGISKEAIIKPGVDFSDLNEVMVIKNV